jgi:hypothetical protein
VLAADADDWLAAATPYLELASLAVCGGLMARQVTWARAHRKGAEADAVTGRFAFFALERLAQAPSLLDAILSGSGRLAAAHFG